MTPWNLRDRVRRLPAGEVIVRGIVFLLGAVFVVAGIALVVLPGPLTIPPILLGLLIWSLEFEFAKVLVDRARVPAQQAWEEAKRHPWRTAVVSGGGLLLASLAFVAAAYFDLLGHARDALT